jgi:hypothetical protein
MNELVYKFYLVCFTRGSNSDMLPMPCTFPVVLYSYSSFSDVSDAFKRWMWKDGSQDIIHAGG